MPDLEIATFEEISNELYKRVQSQELGGFLVFLILPSNPDDDPPVPTDINLPASDILPMTHNASCHFITPEVLKIGVQEIHALIQEELDDLRESS